MQIASVSQHDRAVHPAHARSRPQKNVTAEPAPTVASDPVGADTETDEVSGRTPGVIRHLESGHFRGVADVRLRINFHETLSARAGARAGEASEKEAATLVQSVRDGLGDLAETLAFDPETQGAVEGLLSDFRDVVDSAIGETMNEQALREGFGKLTLALRDLLGTETADRSIVAPVDDMPMTLDGDEIVPPEAAGTEPTEVVEPTRATDLAGQPTDPVDATARLDAAIADLQLAFDAAMDVFMESVHAAGAMSEPTSEPTGNGRAYAKFMAIYTQLTGDRGSVIGDA